MPLPLSNPPAASRFRRSSRPGVLGALLLAVFAANCGLDKLTGDESAASTVRFAVSGDSVLSVGISRPFAITPSEPVNFSNLQLAYDLSDTTLARVDSVRGQTAWVTGLRNGTLRVRLTARSAELPGGRVDSARVRVRFAAIRIDAIDTIAGLGPANGANQRTVVVRGTRPDGSPAAGTPTVTATIVSRDTARLRPTTPGGATFVARDTGLVWLVASFDGALDSVRVPIRRRLTRIVADSLAFGALFTSRSVPVRILDAGDSAIVGTPFRFAGLDTVRLQVDSTGPGASPTAPRLRARVRDTSSYQIQTGSVTSVRARTRVTQVPAGIVLAAGGGQSARYGTALTTPPRIVVRDSGAQGIGGVTVTFSVPNAGNGVITGPSVVTNAAGEAAVGSWQLGPNSGLDSLVATVSGLPPFVVTATALAGPAARVRFVQQPLGGARNGKVQPSPQVAIVDSVDNVVSTATDSIVVARVGTAGGALTGTLTVAAVAGVARFDSLVFADTATAARLVASTGTLGVDTSAVFPIGQAPTQMVFSTQPAAVNGGSLMAPVVVELRDNAGVRSVGAVDTVTLSLNSTFGTLAGTVRRAAVNGRATFNDLRVIGGGGNSYNLLATTAAGLSATSGTFPVNVGPASQLRFLNAPANVGPGMTQQISIAVSDSGGNFIVTTGTNITLRLGTNPGGATITDSVRATNGSTNVILQPAVSVAGTGYTFVASSPGLASATSTPFNVATAGAPARLRWLNKGQTFNQAGFGIPVALELVDAAGVRSTVTRFPFTISILSGPPNASLSATVDSVFSSGVTFASAVRLRTAGVYRLIASGAGVAPDTSGPIVISAGPGTRLALLSQPTATGLGSPVSPVQVALTDSLGNVSQRLTNGTFVGNSLAINAAAINNAGTAVTLGGTLAQTTTNGVATFADLAIGTAGAGYRLTFASGALTSAQSDTFSVRTPGTPRQLRLSALPSVINGGSRISPVVRVAIVDSVGTTVSSRTDSIVLTLRGPAGAVLAGPTRVAAVNGIAQFPTVTIPRADSGLRLVATSNQAGIAADSSPTFRVTVGPVSRLRFLQEPTSLISGARLTPPPIVAATDSGGNIVTTASDSIGLRAFNTTNGFFVGGRNGVALVNGVAQFDSVFASVTPGTELRLQPFSQRNTFYSLQDSTAVLTAMLGAPARVRINWGAGSRAATFTSYFLSGSVVDLGGNAVTTASVPVTLSVIGPTGAVIGGPTTTTSSNGNWQLTPVSLSVPGTYRWVISSPGLASDTSVAFVTTGRVLRPRVVVSPAAAVRNGAMGPVRVILLDTLGQGVALAGAQVSAALSGGSLGGTRTVITTFSGSDTTGVAVFNSLVPQTAGARFLVVTVAPGFGVSNVALADSVALPVAAFGPASALQFTTQPGSIVAGGTMSTSPVVTVLDSVGNTVADSVARSISLSLQQGVQPGTSTPTNGFLTGSLSVTPAPGTGSASFANLSVNNAGNGYSLVATANGVNAAQSAPFNVVQTTDPIALRFVSTTVPTSITAGGGLSGTGGALAVEIINSAGTRVTASTVPVTIGVRNARATIVGTATVNAVAGVATFSSATIQRADTGYVLVATSPALNTAEAPSRLTVNAAQALSLRVLDSLPTVVAGAPWPALRVAVVDGFQNIVTGATQAISLRGSAGVFPGDSSYVTAYGVDALGITLPLTVNAVNGIATFTGLRPRRAASQSFNFLLFDAVGFPTARSSRFTVTAGDAVRAFVDSDSSSAARFVNNQPLSSYLFLLDSLGNCASTVPAQVMLGVRRANGTAAPAGISLIGGTTQSTTGCFTRMPARALAGITASDSLQFTVTAPGITPWTNIRTFVVEPFGAATQLAFLQGPTATNRATNMAPPVTVAVTDNFGNVVSNLSTGANGLTGTITLTLPNATAVGGATTVLGGGAAANIVNGIATFPALQVNNAGTGYQLRAAVTGGTTIPGVAAAVLSALFNIL